MSFRPANSASRPRPRPKGGARAMDAAGRCNSPTSASANRAPISSQTPELSTLKASNLRRHEISAQRRGKSMQDSEQARDRYPETQRNPKRCLLSSHACPGGVQTSFQLDFVYFSIQVVSFSDTNINRRNHQHAKVAVTVFFLVSSSKNSS